MRIKLLIIMISCCLSKMSSQDIYTISEAAEIHRINNDDTVTYITTMDRVFGDIAISPSNKFYGVLDRGIYELNISDGTSSMIYETGFQSYTSLVCDNDYNLYTISIAHREIHKYNILDNTFEVVKDIGERTPGDLTFYKGNLLFQRSAINRLERNIMVYNIQTEELSTVMCMSNKTTDYEFWGLSNQFSSCGEEKIIAYDRDKIFYELDIETDNIIELETEEIEEIIYGTATTNEYLASECTSFEFESITCSTLSIDDIFNSNQNNVYPNPFNEELHLNFNREITSVKFYNLNGKLIKNYKNPGDRLNTSELNSGIYFVQILSENELITVKLVK